MNPESEKLLAVEMYLKSKDERLSRMRRAESSRFEPNVQRPLPKVGGIEAKAPRKPQRPPMPPRQKQMRPHPRKIEGPRVRSIKLPLDDVVYVSRA